MQDVLKLARQVSEDFVKMSEDEGDLKPRGMAEVMVSSVRLTLAALQTLPPCDSILGIMAEICQVKTYAGSYCESNTLAGHCNVAATMTICGQLPYCRCSYIVEGQP